MCDLVDLGSKKQKSSNRLSVTHVTALTIRTVKIRMPQTGNISNESFPPYIYIYWIKEGSTCIENTRDVFVLNLRETA